MGEKKKEKELKKEEKKKEKEMEEKASEEEIDRLIESLEKQIGMEGAKIIRVPAPKKSFRSILINLIASFCLNIFIFIGLNGIFKVAYWDSVLDMLFYALYFSGIEFVLRTILMIFFSKWVMKTMGLIMGIPSLISIVIATIFPIFMRIRNMALFIILMIFVFMIRTTIKHFIVELLIRKHFGGKI